MQSIIRKDEEAVSPVIATILMVAITVVLAAVLYVMVSGLITGPGGTPTAMGVSVQQSGDGTNWIMTITSAPTGKAYTTTTLAIFHTDGSSNLSATALSALSATTNGCALAKASSTATAIQAGDRILCKTTWYVSGTTYQYSDGTNILATGKLR
jgi:archaeal type IV pilus assembly protein PilA